MKRIGIVLLFAAACGSKNKPATAPTNAGGDATASGSGVASGSNADELTAATEPHSTAPVMLKDIQSGDTACWLVVDDDKGQETDAAADYELCAGADHDASSLIGKKVTLGWGHGNVIAASCSGDPDCKKSDSIDLVTTVTAAP